MNEDLLHFIWKYKLYDFNSLKTTTGDNVEVYNVGIENHDSGPDFLNVKVKIGDTIWAGNAELHLKSSHWLTHNHHKDKSYDTVVLHLVLEDDKTIYRSNGEVVPAMKLKFDENLWHNYRDLMKTSAWIPCQEKFSKVNDFIKTHWFHRLTIERLEKKSAQIQNRLLETNYNWEEAFYHQLAWNFGVKVNAQPFELLAKSLPLIVLSKHKSSLFQIEALLFGQAGFLGDTVGVEDEYFKELSKEYSFLKNKYKLNPIDNYLWKLLRLRPSNFPTLRIAQFAHLIHQSANLFSKVMEANNLNDLKAFFTVVASGYWDTHYSFAKPGNKKVKKLGGQMIFLIVINTIVPFLFLYGNLKSQQDLKDKAVRLLEELPAEKNTIIKNWEKMCVKVNNAFISQAMLHLKNEYCNKRKCLQCEIGSKILLN